MLIDKLKSIGVTIVPKLKSISDIKDKSVCLTNGAGYLWIIPSVKETKKNDDFTKEYTIKFYTFSDLSKIKNMLDLLEQVCQTNLTLVEVEKPNGSQNGPVQES